MTCMTCLQPDHGCICHSFDQSPIAVAESRPQMVVNRTYQPSAEVLDAIDAFIGSFKTTPMSHQKIGVAELSDHDRWALFWDMGTGKSACIAYRVAMGLLHSHFKGPILIVSPLSVVDVWRHELEKHVGIEAVVLAGTAKERSAALAKIEADSVVVTNYETLRNEATALQKLGFDCVVTDEVHRVKNTATKTHRALMKISQRSRYRWALSGTPAPNGPLDIFGSLTFLDQSLLGTTSKRIFEARHAIYGHEVAPGIRKIVGYKNLDDIGSAVAKCSSRVTKEECLDLPAKTFVNIPVKLSGHQAQVYKSLKKDAIANLESVKGKGELTLQHLIAESVRLLQVCGGFVPDDLGHVHPLDPNAKINVLKDLIEDFSDEQLIIWCSFRAEVDAVTALFDPKEAVSFHGDLPAKVRRLVIDDFRSGNSRVLVATPQSSREGLTLIESSKAIFYSRTYHLLDWLQTQDRIHRIGQTKSVTIYSLVAQKTIDAKADEALNSKTELQDMLVGGSSLESIFGD